MPSNKRVKKSIKKNIDLEIQMNNNPNIIIIIVGISWRFVTFLVVGVDIRSYKYIEKRFNIIVVKLQIMIALENINSHERQIFNLM